MTVGVALRSGNDDVGLLLLIQNDRVALVQNDSCWPWMPLRSAPLDTGPVSGYGASL